MLEQVCVCVEHLNRCKTSNLLFSSYLYLYIGFISYTHFHLRPRFHLLGRLVRFRFWGFSSLYIYILLYIQCRGVRHDCGTALNEATTIMGYWVWSTQRTCNTISISVNGNRLSQGPARRISNQLEFFPVRVSQSDIISSQLPWIELHQNL